MGFVQHFNFFNSFAFLLLIKNRIHLMEDVIFEIAKSKAKANETFVLIKINGKGVLRQLRECVCR